MRGHIGNRNSPEILRIVRANPFDRFADRIGRTAVARQRKRALLGRHRRNRENAGSLRCAQTAMIATSDMKIRIKKLHPDAILPAYAHGAHEDAGLDLRALERIVLTREPLKRFRPASRLSCPQATKRKSARAVGWRLKHSVTVNFGTIDPGYRGEIRVIMFNLGRDDYIVEKGDRIAQLIVARYEVDRVGRRRAERFHSRRWRIWIIGTMKRFPSRKNLKFVTRRGENRRSASSFPGIIGGREVIHQDRPAVPGITLRFHWRACSRAGGPVPSTYSLPSFDTTRRRARKAARK